MVTKSRQKKLRSLITEAIRVLCKNGLDNDYQEEFSIEGLLGITLDNQDVFLVNINETIRNDEDEDEEDEAPSRVMQRRSVRTPVQGTPTPSPRPSQSSAGGDGTGGGRSGASGGMKRKLESVSPSPGGLQGGAAKRQAPARTTRSAVQRETQDTDNMKTESMPQDQEIEHLSATDAAATEQEIQLIGTLEEGPGEPAAAVTPTPGRSIAPPTGTGQSPSPIIIVPQPKPRHTTMRSNGHRGLQPLHVAIPAPIQAVHIDQLFTDFEEDLIVEHMRHFYEIGWGLINTTTPVSLIGSNYANYLKKTGSTTPHVPLFAKWYRDLKLHKPEVNKYEIRQSGSSASGVRDDSGNDIGQIVSTDQISLYYTKLSEKMKELDLSKRPYDIYMLEETQCEIATSSTEKEIVTVLGCASCTGDVKPPMLTFKGKKQVTASWTEGAMAGTKGFVSVSGIASSSIVQKVLACYFREHSSESQSGYPEHPVLVLYDPRKGNICPGVVEWAESKNIVLFPFPPHFESLLEPLEPGCVTPFKAAYEAELGELSAENANFIAHKANVCAIVCRVYERDVTPKTVIDAFIKLGIQVSRSKPKPAK